VNLEVCELGLGAGGYTGDKDPLYWAVPDALLIGQLSSFLAKFSLTDVAQRYVSNAEQLAVGRIDALRQHDVPYPRFSLEKTRQWLIPLANDLNLAMSQRYRPPPVRFVVVEGECGAGETEWELTTQPTSAIISVINAFNFTLCEVRHIDPWSPASCHGWNEAVTSVLELAGDYHYLARWPDGAVTRGHFSIEEVPKDNEHRLIIKR